MNYKQFATSIKDRIVRMSKRETKPTHRQNDTVSTQPMLEPIANHRLLSITYDDGRVSRLPSPFLPTDLIMDILLRLPVKYILQFKCVCKLWKTLISNPEFAKKHLLISTADPSTTDQRLTFFVSTGYLKSISYSYPLKTVFENPSTIVTPDSFIGLKNGQYSLLGSCNGLMCLFDQDQFSVIIYNPSINFKSKHSPKLLPSPNWLIGLTGLGYDHVNDKYKVFVNLEHEENPYEFLTQIYTFGEDSWKTIHNFPFTILDQSLGIHVGGAINWIGFRGYNSVQTMILSFDPEKETYGEVLLPQNVGGYVCRHKLHVLRNCLCVCFENKTHWVVWLMKEYGVVESWTKLMSIPLDLWNSLPVRLYTIELFFISENGVVLLRDPMCRKLILYNLNSGGSDYTFISIENLMSLHTYRESLISPQW